jgi:hypothetical protein
VAKAEIATNGRIWLNYERCSTPIEAIDWTLLVTHEFGHAMVVFIITIRAES